MKVFLFLKNKLFNILVLGWLTGLTYLLVAQQTVIDQVTNLLVIHHQTLGGLVNAFNQLHLLLTQQVI